MAEVIIPEFIQKYMNAIHEKEATTKFVELASNYHKSVESAINSIAEKNDNAVMWAKRFGTRPEVNLSKELNLIEVECKLKSHEIAKLYINDEKELDLLSGDEQQENILAPHFNKLLKHYQENKENIMDRE